MISEIDLKDWIPTEQPVKLYEVPRETVIQIHTYDGLIMFHHIDGMYSLCTILTGEYKGHTTHIQASTKVTPWKKIS